MKKKIYLKKPKPKKLLISNKSDINSFLQKYKNNSDNKSNESQNDKNRALSQITPKFFDKNNKIK